MMFATLGPGFSLGNGLNCAFDLLEIERIAYRKSNSDSHCCGKPNGQSERSPARLCELDGGTKGPQLDESFGTSVEFAFLGCVAWLAEVVSTRSSGYRIRSSGTATVHVADLRASPFPLLPASIHASFCGCAGHGKVQLHNPLVVYLIRELVNESRSW